MMKRDWAYITVILGSLLLAVSMFVVAAVVAQQLPDYDPVLTPYLTESREFCLEAPSCARMLYTDGDEARSR